MTMRHNANRRWNVFFTLVLSAAMTWWPASADAGGPMGPLTVHPQNPRYFADGNGNAVYLTGSHTWSNLVDDQTSYFQVTFDFTGYLDTLESLNHNFIRLWASEQTQYQYPGEAGMHITGPLPWARPGPGVAGDGGPRFDLNQFNQDYFNRLRSRCISAGNRGMYVSIMLFEGHAMQYAQDAWFSHPFNSGNNINGVSGDSNGDGSGLEVQMLGNTAVLNLQKAYIRKVIETVNDLDNVMFEICNESHRDSLPWQKHLVNYIKSYESGMPQQHPVLLTTTFPGVFGGELWNSNADAVSPGTMEGDYGGNPPAANGDKVIIADSDHLFGCGGSVDWVWKSFTRGLNPIYMDTWYDDSPFCFAPDHNTRRAMGHTRSLAQRVDMAKMRPHNSFASSGYCLSDNAGTSIVYLPDGGGVNLNTGIAGLNLTVEWVRVSNGTSADGGTTGSGGTQSFNAPFSGAAVLFVHANGGGGGPPPPAPPPVPPPPGGLPGELPQPRDGDRYGRAVANAGDVNADGYWDLIVGAPFADVNGKVDAGQAYVLVYSPQTQDFRIRFVAGGQGTGDRFGWAVSTAGDFDLDGFDDVLIGAPRNNQGGIDAGKVYIYSGRTGGILGTKIGEGVKDEFGSSVAGGLNVNGGRGDFMVGAPLNNAKAIDAGAVYIYSGSGSMPLIKRLTGQFANDRFGSSVAAVGRTDSDANDDFIVGAPYCDANGVNSGRVYLYSGRTFGIRFMRDGAKANDRFGWSVAGIGSANPASDSRPDFAVGSPYFDSPGKVNAGRVSVFSGFAGGLLWSRGGEAGGDLMGWSIARGFDVNGSGSGDVVVGAPNHDAAGVNAGRAYVFSGSQGDLLNTFDGSSPGEQFGRAVAGLGDVNDNWELDVSIGASENSQNGTLAGTVYLIGAPQ